ncbi:MAG: hypothetical protein ACLPX9_18125 [Rhodomicrobium sp.]
MAGDLEILGARPRGRPTLYDAAHCDRAIALAAQGCGKAEIAAALCIGRKTLDSWGTAHPEFREAMRRAKDLEYAWWLKAGREGQFIKTWNAASWALQMRNRFGKRFEGRSPAAQASEEPRDATNAERIRDQMERKLSRIADAGTAQEVSCEPDGGGAEKPGL